MADSLENPVFIVGLPRAASKWIMNAINTYTECCIAHEMHILRLWRRGNDSTIRAVANDSAGNRVDALMDLALSERLIGCFWRLRGHEYTVFNLDPSELEAALAGVADGRTMLMAMMETQRRHYNKQRSGARHPVHFIHLGRLFKWFPQARVLFVTRPMGEIARSWCALRVPRETSRIRRVLWTMGISFQSYLNALLAKPVLWARRSDSRVLVVPYHELVAQPSATFERICTHLRTSFDPRMANRSRVYDSAYDPATRGIPPYSIKWSPPASQVEEG